jgi:glycosyltransferase involved in cell wall biosynthesis
MNNQKMKVALVGPFPPPYGGISVHIQRLTKLLDEHDVQCTIYDATQLFTANKIKKDSHVKKLPKIIEFNRGIVHIHSAHFNLLKIFLLSNLLKIKHNKIIITYHSFRNEIQKTNRLTRTMMRFCFTHISHFFVVNQKIKEKLITLGIEHEKITVLPGFLPPIILKKDIEDIPSEIWKFIENHHPIISANAYKIVFYNNQDLYGIDMCIDLCITLKKKYPQIGFVFCLPSIGDKKYFTQLKDKITENDINNNFIFVTEPYQFYPILMKSDLFVRPTNTDGDAISIRESIFYKIPSVVSDVVPRPQDTTLFHNRDTNDFTLKVENVLKNYENYKKELENLNTENTFEKIMHIYQKLNKE